MKIHQGDIRCSWFSRCSHTLDIQSSAKKVRSFVFLLTRVSTQDCQAEKNIILSFPTSCLKVRARHNSQRCVVPPSPQQKKLLLILN